MELIEIKPRLLENMRQRRTFDRPVRRNRQSEYFAGHRLLQTDMAAALSDSGPAVSLKRTDDLDVAQAWDPGQRVSSLTKLPSAGAVSSRGSR